MQLLRRAEHRRPPALTYRVDTSYPLSPRLTGRIQASPIDMCEVWVAVCCWTGRGAPTLSNYATPHELGPGPCHLPVHRPSTSPSPALRIKQTHDVSNVVWHETVPRNWSARVIASTVSARAYLHAYSSDACMDRPPHAIALRCSPWLSKRVIETY